jgi:hypothetical protein
VATHWVSKVRLNRVDIDFLSARLEVDELGLMRHWRLHVEGPTQLESLVEALSQGTTLTVAMHTRDGHDYRGEAFVTSTSETRDGARLVAFTGSGPLRSW